MNKRRKVRKTLKRGKGLAKTAARKAKGIAGKKIGEMKKILSATKKEVIKEVKKAGLLSKSEAAKLKAELSRMKTILLGVGKKVAARSGKTAVNAAKKRLNKMSSKKPIKRKTKKRTSKKRKTSTKSKSRSRKKKR